MSPTCWDTHPAYPGGLWKTQSIYKAGHVSSVDSSQVWWIMQSWLPLFGIILSIDVASVIMCTHLHNHGVYINR